MSFSHIQAFYNKINLLSFSLSLQATFSIENTFPLSENKVVSIIT